MKKNEIQKGELYLAKVNGKTTTVKVNEIVEETRYAGKNGTYYHVTNIATGRKTTFRSAQKFISVAPRPTPAKPTASAQGQTASGGLKKSPIPVTHPEEEKKIDEAREKAYRMTPAEKRRVEQIESKYSTEKGATEEERKEAQDILEGKGRKPSLKEQGVIGKVEKVTGLGGAINRAVQPPKHSKKPTLEQENILSLVSLLNGKGIKAEIEGGVIVIEAGAGTGKTTTLRMVGDTLNGRGQYTAFNKSLVEDSKAKFRGTRVDCNTTHSLAFRAEGKRFAHRLEGRRIRSEEIAKILGIEDLILESVTTDKGTSAKRIPAGFLASVAIGAVRRFCQSADRQIGKNHFKFIDGIDFPNQDGSRNYDNNEKVREYLLPFAKKAWEDFASPEGTLPYSADYYVKVWQLNHPVIAADYILLDEAQDTAPVMLDILAQQVQLGTPVILVGDSAQQIYEWRGAVNALGFFKNAPIRQLSQSFRFGEAIAEVANLVLDLITERITLRLKGLPSIASRLETLEDPTCILCRTNACAVGNLLSAIAAGKKPFLIGGGSDVIAFVEASQRLQKGESVSHPDLACFSNWAEVEEYSKLEEGEDLKLMVKLINEFGAEEILNALRSMPKESEADLVISTAHKSKGREWRKVKLAGDFPTASKSSDSDLKLLYVAVTRAKELLDVSECPAFSDKDGIGLDHIINSQPARREEDEEQENEEASIISPAPSELPKGEFTWTRWNDAWKVSGPLGHEGKAVSVVKKNGEAQAKTLGKVLWKNESRAVYEV